MTESKKTQGTRHTSTTKQTENKTVNKPTASASSSVEEAKDVQEWRAKVLKLMARVSSYMAISTLAVNFVYTTWVNATSICLPEGSESSILGILSFFGAIVQLGYFEAKYRATNGHKGWLF